MSEIFSGIDDRHPAATDLTLDAVAIGQRRGEAVFGAGVGGRRRRDRPRRIRHALDYTVGW
jgi:hypothetical protein